MDGSDLFESLFNFPSDSQQNKYLFPLNGRTKYLVPSMIEWLLFNANSAIFQLHNGEYKLIFNEMMMRSAL